MCSGKKMTVWQQEITEGKVDNGSIFMGFFGEKIFLNVTFNWIIILGAATLVQSSREQVAFQYRTFMEYILLSLKIHRKNILTRF